MLSEITLIGQMVYLCLLTDLKMDITAYAHRPTSSHPNFDFHKTGAGDNNRAKPGITVVSVNNVIIGPMGNAMMTFLIS